MRPTPSLRSALVLVAAALLPACDMLPGLLGAETPGEEGSGGAGSGGGEGGEGGTVVTCEVRTVDDPAECGEVCNAVIEGLDGRSMCTTACETQQDCEGSAYRCEIEDDGGGACFLDCSGSDACPDDYACDQESELCIPVSLD